MNPRFSHGLSTIGFICTSIQKAKQFVTSVNKKEQTHRKLRIFCYHYQEVFTLRRDEFFMSPNPFNEHLGKTVI